MSCWPEPELPLMPLPAPPKASLLAELGVLRTCWLPTRSGSSAAVRVHVACTGTARLPVSRVPALGPAPRFDVSRVAGTWLLARLILAGVGLARLHGVATGVAAVLVGGTSVAIRSSAAVLRVVLPVAVTSIAAVHAVAAVDAIAVVDEVVVVD